MGGVANQRRKEGGAEHWWLWSEIQKSAQRNFEPEMKKLSNKTVDFVNRALNFCIILGFKIIIINTVLVFRVSLLRFLTPLALEPFGFHICQPAIWEIIFPDNHRKALLLPITFTALCWTVIHSLLIIQVFQFQLCKLAHNSK